MKNLIVREIGPQEVHNWDRFVTESPTGTIFSNSSWMRVLNNSPNGTSFILGVFDKEEIVGGLLCFESKKGPIKILGHPPMTPFNPIIVKSNMSKRFSKIEKRLKQIISAITEYLVKKYNYISIFLTPHFLDIRPLLWNGWQPYVNYTYEIDLHDVDQLWNQIDKNAKYEINKAKKNGLKISNDKEEEEFYNLYDKTFQKQNLNPPISLDFFKNLVKIIIQEKKGKLYFASNNEDVVVASALVVWDDKKAYYLMASSDPIVKVGAPSFLLWNIIVDMSDRFKSIDLVGANTPHIIKFKREFSTSLVPYYSVEKFSSVFIKFIYNIYKKKFM